MSKDSLPPSSASSNSLTVDGDLAPSRATSSPSAAPAAAADSHLRHEKHLQQQRDLRKFTGLYTGPYFDQSGNPGNVTAELGQTAMLPCRVKQIGEKTVR
jgi:hypothetical protein